MRAWSVWLLAGCNQLFGIHDLSVGTGSDASLDDATSDTAPPCVGSTFPGLTHCFASPPPALEITSDIDTDTAACDALLSPPAGPEVCAIIGGDVTVGGVRVTGSRPLAVFALHTISITNTIDASSSATGPGAGANTSLCGTQSNGGFAGGGPGGSFQGLGGIGGVGNGGLEQGGGPANKLPHSIFAGGCPGGVASTSASGGNGGGALYFASAGKIDVFGQIYAAGEGANGGDIQGGGGGGGAGGMVVLEAPDITFAGNAVAIGGGGGGGGSPSVHGGNGQDGVSGGGGGPGANGAGDGGSATGLDGNPGNDGTANGLGGGGGGGGAGYIVAITTTFNDAGGTITPPPIVLP